MDDADGDRWVTSAEAARLSANFPWGFDVVRLPGAGGAEPVELLDGGIVDNTGIDTFARLFERLALIAGEGLVPPVGVPAEETAKAQALLAALRARGVLLVEIDAGARPGETSGASALFPGFTRPLRALDAAGSNNAFAARDDNVDRIRQILDADEGGFIHLAWICNRIDNVQTAWSLGTRDRAVTTLQFLAEQHRLAPLLAELASAYGKPEDEFQRRIDEAALHTRQFQVAVASDNNVAEVHLNATLTAIDAGSRVGKARALKLAGIRAGGPGGPAGARAVGLPLGPEDANKAAEAAEKAAEEALNVAKEARRAANQAVNAAESVEAALKDPANAAQHAEDALKSTEKAVNQAKKAGADVKSITDAAEDLLKGTEKKEKKKSK